MKTFFYSLVALFTMATLHAQKITEKDLLGEWNPILIDIQGMTVNFKTDEVTFSEEMKQMIEDSGEDAEAAKPMILDGIKSQGFEDFKAEFKPGFKTIWTKDGTPKEFDYKIIEENGSTYLVRNDDRKMKVTLESGVLKLVLGEGEGQSIVLGFEKKK